MANQPKERVAGDTSKAKPNVAKQLGMTLAALESQQICWVPVPLDNDTREMLLDLSSLRKKTMKAILSELCVEALDRDRKALEKEAEKAARVRAEDMTEDELTKQMAAVQRRLEKLNATLAAKKKG
jgi:hypothetical protein